MIHTEKMVTLAFRPKYMKDQSLKDYSIVMQMPIAEFMSPKLEDIAVDIVQMTVSEEWRKAGKRSVAAEDLLFVGLTAWAYVPTADQPLPVTPLPRWSGYSLLDMGTDVALAFCANISGGVYG